MSNSGNENKDFPQVVIREKKNRNQPQKLDELFLMLPRQIC